MKEPNWVRRRPDLSWHIVRQPSLMNPLTHWKALCGKLIEGEPVDFWNEGKSCEACMRINRDRD